MVRTVRQPTDRELCARYVCAWVFHWEHVLIYDATVVMSLLFLCSKEE